MRQFLIAASAVASIALSAQANVVLDGGFESAINATNGWTTNAGPWGQNPLGLTTFTPHSGSFYAAATSSSNATRTNTLSQVLALTAGNIVDFSMWYELSSNSAIASITVSLDGNVIYTATPGAGNITTWNNIAVSGITIANNNPTFTISQTISGRTSSFVLDDVSIEIVPAPASALLGLGAMGMMARRRR